MTGWWLPLVAFVSMAAQDLLGVRLVQAEAAYRPHLAASMDTAQDICQLASLAAIGDGIVGGHLLLAVATIAARLLADYTATYTGVRLGALLDRNRKGEG